jgi:hypothetical protein
VIGPGHRWSSSGCSRRFLTEHWRVVFRRHYFTSRASLDRSLPGFMQFYNFGNGKTHMPSE